MKFKEILPLIDNLYTTMPVEEKKVLYKYACKVPDNGIIVDIGTCDGNSAFIMALANPTVKVWTIDPKVGKEFLSKRKELGLEDRVCLIPHKSNDAINEWLYDIDLLFIDGFHSIEAISNDIDNWGKFVKKDSKIILHDYFWYTDVVQKAMNKASIKLKLLEVPFGIYNEKKVGIAITQKL